MRMIIQAGIVKTYFEIKSMKIFGHNDKAASLSNMAQQIDPNYDDLGDGKYGHMGVSERIPLHAQKAKEFFDKRDFWNAEAHAKKCIALGAAGWIGTEPYLQAERILKDIDKFRDPKRPWEFLDQPV